MPSSCPNSTMTSQKVQQSSSLFLLLACLASAGFLLSLLFATCTLALTVKHNRLKCRLGKTPKKRTITFEDECTPKSSFKRGKTPPLIRQQATLNSEGGVTQEVVPGGRWKVGNHGNSGRFDCVMKSADFSCTLRP